MTDLMHYKFIDETGNIIFSSENHFLIVAALGTNNRNSISRIIRNTQKKFGASLSSGELKAKKESAFVIRHVLTLLSKEPIQIFTVVVDKKILNIPLKDPEEIYRWTISRLISMVVKKYPKVEIVLDRRYTNEHPMRGYIEGSPWAPISF
jgi:formaldehyde-activating enzyme involved in methanogenesis